MRLTVIVSHKTSYPDPIGFTPGERLKLGRRDDRYPGWIWTTTPDGKGGWAPESLIDIESPGEGTALAAYNARELDTAVGELVTGIRELHGWLWVKNQKGDSGWIPKETVILLQPPDT